MSEKLESIDNGGNLEFSPDSNTGNQGIWFLGRFICFNKDFKRSVIVLKRSEESINYLLEFITWIIIFGGWLAFASWLYFNRVILLADPIKALFFWRQADPLIAIFLFSLLFDLFLVYKSSEKKSREEEN